MIGPVLGAVLAGGRSRRFGSDKADALLDGKPLIAHAMAALRPHVAELVLCGREMAGVPCLDDRPRGGLGPLAGLNAALHHANAHGHAGVLSIGCDMPLLPADAVRALIGADDEHEGGAVILHGQHLVGYWPSDLAPMLESHLARGEDRSIRGFLTRARARARSGWRGRRCPTSIRRPILPRSPRAGPARHEAGETGARRRVLPAMRHPEIRPMEAKLAAELPAADGWQYEPKWDGFRCLARREGDAVTLTSKSGKPLARYFPEVAAMLGALPQARFLIDGELIIPIGDILSFAALQARLHPAASRVARLAGETPAELMLFDCLESGGTSLIDRPPRRAP